MAQHLFPSLLPEVCMLHSEHSDFIPSVQHPLLNSFGKHLSGEKKKKKEFQGRKAILFSFQSLKYWIFNHRY